MNKQHNFTFSDFWTNAVYDRFSEENILKINDLLFAKIDDIFRCQHFFEFSINPPEYNKLLTYLNKNNKFRFNYIDQNLFDNINNWCKLNELNLEIIDCWEAPKLKLTSNRIENYLLSNCGKQTKKNYLKYKNSFNDYVYLDSNCYDMDKLWNDVLSIDKNSWKYREQSDMKSLNREDLQYKKFLYNNRQNSFLNVVYRDDVPIAYSLFFKNIKTKQWYAVKWGASDLGRKYYAGFFCLYNHLEKIEKSDGMINIDFWGRRSPTYNLLKNYEDNRYHILVSKWGA